MSARAARHETEILTVAEVMARYRLRDRRSARRLMDEAGAFRLSAQLYVRLDDLLALEERQKATRRPADLEPAGGGPRSVGSPGPLRPGWWRRDDGGAD